MGKEKDNFMQELKDIQEKDKKQKYNKMCREYRKKLVQIGKDAGPWDYCFGLEFLIEHLRFMRDYYALGYNVWGEEDKKPENDRLTLASKMVAEYEASEELPSEEVLSVAQSLGIKVPADFKYISKDNIQISIVAYLEKHRELFPNKDMNKDFVLAIYEREQQHLKNFWKLVQNKLQYLWD